MPIDRERYARTTAALLDSPHDAILSSDASNVLLLTGYWPVMSASVAIFCSDGQVRVIVPEDELEVAQKTTNAELVPYKPAGLHALEGLVSELREPLHSALRSLGLGRAALGMALGQMVQPASYVVSYRFREELATLLGDLVPDAQVTSCDSLLEELKAAKTAKELQILKAAGQIASKGFTEAARCIEAGLRETEVAALVQGAFDRTPIPENFERSYGFFFCMSGENSARAAAAYARTRQRVIQQGDLVMIHANTCADGFWTDITRTFTVGPPSQRQTEMRTAIDEARAAGLRSIRPGVTGAEVDSAARSVMDAHGFGKEFKHAAGHGVGYAAANPNSCPRIHPSSPDVLKSGMTFNLEPAAYFDGYGGMRHCDVIAVMDEGARVLTDF